LATTQQELTPSSPIPYRRALAIVMSAAGVLAAIATLTLIWIETSGALLARFVDMTDAFTALVLLGIALLIGWRAGDHPPNVAMALALAFAIGGDSLIMLAERMHADRTVVWIAARILFFLGAAFYIRASQLFPRELTAGHIAASPTVWGRFRALRASATFALRIPVAWSLAALLTLPLAISDNAHVHNAAQIGVVSIGILYFYITYRGDDAEAKGKVLWFFDAALATLVIAVVAIALRAALMGSDSPELRQVLQVIVTTVNAVALVTCFTAAVFYAGAVTPALIVRKTLVYGATVAALLFLFAAAEIYIVESLVHALHVDDRFASAFLGALFGLGFHPLKQRIEHFLKRFAPQE
jgi:hypothetical protein